MNLTTAQIGMVRSVVDQGGLTLNTLREDVLDHLCCEVEEQMKSGRSFDDALRAALYQLAPAGLHEIQHETDYLLNVNMIPMKKVTYLLGLLSAMAMSFGWLLRILRMGELGNAVFALGALGFVALFLPLLVIHYFRDNVGKPWADKLRFVLGILSAIFIGIAFLFKIMHMPGADELLWIGGILFTFGFLPFLFFTFYRKSITPSGK